MGEDRIAKHIMYSTMDWEGRRRRRNPGPDLSKRYWDLALAFRGRLPREIRRGATWLSLCRDRPLYRTLCRGSPVT